MNKIIFVSAITASTVTLALAACGTSRAPAAGNTRLPTSVSATPSSSASPSRGPVFARAVTGNCVTGVLDFTTSDFYSMADILNGPAAGAAGDKIAEAYQLKLTNTSASATTEVSGFTVVFYPGSQHTTSDAENLSKPAFLNAGQSLTWTEYPWGTYTAGQASVGPFAAGDTGAIDISATCQLEHAYQP